MLAAKGYEKDKGPFLSLVDFHVKMMFRSDVALLCSFENETNM